MSIPIFDTLTHPSLDGSWIHSRWNGKNSFSQLSLSLQEANVKWAFAVSMGTSGAYDIHKYPKACLSVEKIILFPIAFLDFRQFSDLNQLEKWLRSLPDQGFKGVKLHPRLSRFDLDHPLLVHVIIESNKLNLLPLFCTYFYSQDIACSNLTIDNLRRFLHKIPNEKIILLHGGTTRLLELSEMTRPFKSVMLDLSFTMCEFSGSSIDLDLRYVMRRCRGRVCIGSDSPEISPLTMRSRFEDLAEGLSLEHREEIAFRNMFTFSGLAQN